MTDFVVVREHPSLLTYVDALQRKNVDALSFYPKAVFEREAALGRLFLALLNGEPCGYIYTGSGRGGVMRCHQVCIQYDARRRLYGASLVTVMEDHANAIGVSEVALRCGSDLDANVFWREMAYDCIGHQEGGIRRRRVINLWRKAMSPALFENVHIEPSRRPQDARLWAAHKQTGIVTQFSRGKRLRDYRAAIVAAAEADAPQGTA